MRSLAVVDTGPLLASIDSRDRDHARCVSVLSRRDLRFVIPTLVVAEVAHFAADRVGPSGEAAFVRRLQGADVEAPEPDDWLLIADLVERYADLRLGTTDASVAVLAERLGTDLIVTLDRRHFSVIRGPGGQPYRLLPEPPSVHEEAASYGSGPMEPGR